METLDDVNHKKFKYIFIPREPLDDVRVLEFEGLEKDFRKQLQVHFSRDNLLKHEKEDLAKQLSETVKEGLVTEDYINLAVETSQTYQIIPLTLPTNKNNFDGVNLYIDSVSRIKNLPTNARATRIASDNIRGDCFISRTFDDETTFKRLDFTLSDFQIFLESPPTCSKRWNQAEALVQLQQNMSNDNLPGKADQTTKSAPQCSNCAKTQNLKQCTLCKKSFYCSVSCQKEDRRFHKRICSLSH